jgi:hypothetical protein
VIAPAPPPRADFAIDIFCIEVDIFDNPFKAGRQF